MVGRAGRSLLTRCLLLAVFIGLTWPWAAHGQDGLLGDVADGNRSHPVHLLELFDTDGSRIRATDAVAQPFSLQQTCQECHSHSVITSGWHFNAGDPAVPPGRSGEPWLLVDHVSATQVPLSRRGWAGTWRPERFGLTPFAFTAAFGRHSSAGAGPDADPTESLDTYLRWGVSGSTEVNCLSCHATDPGQDQAEYARQIGEQNFRWAATAASGFAAVTGSAGAMPDNYDIYTGWAPDLGSARPPAVHYDPDRFDSQQRVLFELARKAPAERCYFCHSSTTVGRGAAARWAVDEDVHLAAGLSCVDCHRNGMDHAIVRGYEGEAREPGRAAAAGFSCAGCHLGDLEAEVMHGGRLGAPNPEHRGIPVVHFDEMSCTACHSGPWPAAEPSRSKLSRTHALGTYGARKADAAAPHVLAPVYGRDADGKIAPQRIVWPSYWGFLAGDEIDPAPLDTVRALALARISSDSGRLSPIMRDLREGAWPRFTEAQIAGILADLAAAFPEAGEPVYVAGGKILSSADGSRVSGRRHAAAQPYRWALAHDVRPAAQSLGVRGCSDCHSPGAPFLFAEVTAPVPFDFTAGTTVQMTALQDASGLQARVLAFSFLFRPLVKYLLLLCCGVMLMVLTMYSLRGLQAIAAAGSDRTPAA